jgi:hypothetical protein
MLTFRDARGLQRVYALTTVADAHLPCAARLGHGMAAPAPLCAHDHRRPGLVLQRRRVPTARDELMWHVSLCTPHSHATHGIAERANRTLLDHARAMLHSCRLGEDFWPWAVKYAAWLDNRFPPSAGGASPYEEYFGMQCSPPSSTRASSAASSRTGSGRPASSRLAPASDSTSGCHSTSRSARSSSGLSTLTASCRPATTAPSST